MKLGRELGRRPTNEELDAALKAKYPFWGQPSSPLYSPPG